MLYLPAEFPQDPDLCYLNHAAVGPWPRRTAQTVANFAQQNMLRGAEDYPDWLEVESSLRRRLARMINAKSSDDIALTKNTSDGLSIISQGLDWMAGDEVVGIKGDFCSNQMPWEALSDHGVSYRPVDALQSDDPEGELIAAISDKTRLLAVSTVHFATGYRFDMKRLSDACRRNDILLSVDVIQSLGAVNFDLAETPVDFVTCGGHKWLLSPEGLGFMYCRPDLRDQLHLHQFGWAMRESPYAFESESWEPARSARRFESGTQNMLGIHAMEASLSLFEELGMDFVEKRLADNVSYLEAGLSSIPGTELITPRDPAKRAGILTFRYSDLSAKVLHTELMKNRVICAARASGIRLAPHFYTSRHTLKSALDHVTKAIRNIK